MTDRGLTGTHIRDTTAVNLLRMDAGGRRGHDLRHEKKKTDRHDTVNHARLLLGERNGVRVSVFEGKLHVEDIANITQKRL